MPSTEVIPYQYTRLANTEDVTRKEKRQVRSALAKSVCSSPIERLIVRVDYLLPNKLRKSRKKEEAIAKLLRQLKAEGAPLGHCGSDEERVLKADQFLPTPKGVSWVASWFLPNESTFVEPQRSQQNRTSADSVATGPVSLGFRPSPIENIVNGTETGNPATESQSEAGQKHSISMVSSLDDSSITLPSPTISAQSDPLFILHGSLEPGQTAESGYHEGQQNDAFRCQGSALCLRCCRFHSTTVGGPFLLWFPTRPTSGAAQMVREESDGSCRIWMPRNVLVSIVVGFVAWLVKIRTVLGQKYEYGALP